MVVALERHFAMSLTLDELDLSGNTFEKVGSAALESWLVSLPFAASLQCNPNWHGWLLLFLQSYTRSSKLRKLNISNSSVVISALQSLR